MDEKVAQHGMRLTGNNHELLPETELVAQIVAGDERAAVYLLLDRCGPALKYLCQVKYRSANLELDETVSEVFALLKKNDWKALRDFRGQSTAGRACSLSHYVLCIAARLLQKKSIRLVKETTWLKPLDDIEDYAVPDEREDRRRTAADVIEGIMALESPADRAVLLLYKIEGREVNEVASIMRTTPANVYTRCNRAIERLRASMGEARSYA